VHLAGDDAIARLCWEQQSSIQFDHEHCEPDPAVGCGERGKNDYNGGYPMSLRMRTLCIFAVAILTAADCRGQAVKETLPCDPMKLDSLIGTVSLSLGTDSVVKKGTSCIQKLWHQNRAGGDLDFYLSNAFLALMEENPPTFFVMMSNDAQTFDEWIQQLPDLSFTWSEPPPCALEDKRKQLISILEHAKIREPKAVSFKEQALRRLSSIRCRQID
jgi:hypothetical protein